MLAPVKRDLYIEKQPQDDRSRFAVKRSAHYRAAIGNSEEGPLIQPGSLHASSRHEIPFLVPLSSQLVPSFAAQVIW
jgi:hypothetical protein